MIVPKKNHYKERIKFMEVVKKTGINSDYYNEFISCRAITTKYENDSKKAYELFKKYHLSPFVKYTDRRKKSGIVSKITKKNKRQVKFLDRIVDELNSMREYPSMFGCERARTLADRAYVLIYGKRKT